MSCVTFFWDIFGKFLFLMLGFRRISYSAMHAMFDNDLLCPGQVVAVVSTCPSCPCCPRPPPWGAGRPSYCRTSARAPRSVWVTYNHRHTWAGNTNTSDILIPGVCNSGIHYQLIGAKNTFPPVPFMTVMLYYLLYQCAFFYVLFYYSALHSGKKREVWGQSQ